MGRTTVNLIGNCLATVVIARWENVFDYEKMKEFVRQSKEESIGTEIENFAKNYTAKSHDKNMVTENIEEG